MWLMILAVLSASEMSPRTTCVASAGTAFRRVALNGDAASRTFVIENPQGKYTRAHVDIFRTRVAGTNLTLACLYTTGSEAPAGVRGTCPCDSSGSCACTQRTLTSPGGAASETWSVPIDIDGWTRVACTVASASAGVTDLATCVQRLVTQ